MKNPLVNVSQDWNSREAADFLQYVVDEALDAIGLKLLEGIAQSVPEDGEALADALVYEMENLPYDASDAAVRRILDYALTGDPNASSSPST